MEEVIRERSAELQMLLEMQREGGFTPRSALARTPPQGFSTPLGVLDGEGDGEELPMAGEKRVLSSPEEVQEAVRRRLAATRRGRGEAPPLGGLLARPRGAGTSSPTTSTTDELQKVDEEAGGETAPRLVQTGQCMGAAPAVDLGPGDPLATAPVEQLAGIATGSTRGIMEAVRSRTSKLNKEEISLIGAHTERLNAVITHLLMRLAAAGRVAPEDIDGRAGQVQPVGPVAARSFASALKLGRNMAPVPISGREGPILVIRPADDQKGTIKTADDTRAALKKHIDPAKLGLQIAGVRRAGNAGVVVQTRSAKEAESLRKAVPPTLRVSSPAERKPLIALTGVDASTTTEELITDLHKQNLRDDPKWPHERIKNELRTLYRRQRRDGRVKVIAECGAELRRVLIERGRVYVGWDVVDVSDHVGVTCCNRCQQYGHPEKYCRGKALVCGKCGDEGHRAQECGSAESRCATCTRFGRPGAEAHRTAARDCPARLHAEARAAAQTSY